MTSTPKTAFITVAASLLLATLTSMGSASAGEDPPPPNQSCDSDSSHTTTTTAEGEGESTFSTSDEFDKTTAESQARRDLLNDLEIASGVVCFICWDGAQCKRTANVGPGSITFEFTVIEGNTPKKSGWSVDASYDGDYTVKCEKCPKKPDEF